MRAPMMKIHTVAAGGGSILSFDGARFRVGPASAGADPGPAAYRRGGPLTVTDANLMTGKLIPDLFPKVFGPQRRRAARRQNRARALCGARARYRRRAGAGGGRRRISRHCGREDGRGDQDDFGCARLRRHALCAQLLRRRGRPARLRRRRRLGDHDRPHPSVFVAALGLWHGTGRHRRAAGARGRRAPSHRSARSDRRHRGSARRRGGRRGRRAGGRAGGDQGPSPRAAALFGLRYDDRGSALDASGDAARVRKRPQKPLRLHRSGQGDRHRGGVGRGCRRRGAAGRADPTSDIDRAARSRPRDALLFAWGAGARRMSFCARRLPSAPTSMGRRSSSSRIRRSSSNRAGAPRSQQKTMC